ncbi:MAG: hypothetical protein WBM24_13680 [Candidatus Sulfotelmatobacter sp.]
MHAIRITFDTTEAEAQIDELGKLLREVFVEHLPNEIIGVLSKLSFEISIADRSSTLGTDGIMEHRIVIRFGRRFHDFMSALRTGKINDLIIAHDGVSNTKVSSQLRRNTSN